MMIVILVICIACLVVLITWVKLNPFLAFLLVSTLAGVLLGIPLANISKSVNKGIGDTLGSLVIVIVLGAMLGKLVAVSGAAQRIASIMQNLFGEKYLIWAMTLTGFVVGVPLYYNVGFVILIPIIFSVAYRFKLPLVYVGLPMLASLSVMHGFLPPHPSPLVLINQFNADISTTFGYGIIIAIPAIIIAGPIFSSSLKGMTSNGLSASPPIELLENRLPGAANSLLTSLLPVLIISVTTLLGKIIKIAAIDNVLTFIAEPNVVMSLTILIATFTLGINMGKKLSDIMVIYSDAVKDIAMILLIISSAGILKQILYDSGLSTEIADLFSKWQLPPLVLAWIITAILRLALGSATIAGLTASGIIFPMTLKAGVDPNLLVLSIGAGSLFCSHVNDTAFWLFKEYFGLTIKETFRSWTVMETLVSIIGLIGVLALNEFLNF